MALRRLIAAVLALVGFFFLAYEGLALVAEAGTDAGLDPVDVVACVGGLSVAGASFLVAGRRLTLGYLVCTAAGLLVASGVAPGGTRGRLVLWGTVAVAMLVSLPFIIRRLRTNAAEREHLYRTGALAVGTVLSIADTGVTINKSYQVRLRLRVAPLDGGPTFDVERKALVSRLAIPRAGERYGVVFDPTDRSRFEVISDARTSWPERIRQLIALVEAGPAPSDEPPSAAQVP